MIALSLFVTKTPRAAHGRAAWPCSCAAIALLAAVGCGDALLLERDHEATTVELRGLPVTTQAVLAQCSADVQGIGAVDVESDYLPHVIACENGQASLEALKAQAVAARSYLYYKTDAYPGQPISDGQGDQVYTCNNVPSAAHYAAVAATAGEVLVFQESYVAAFYVAGAVPSEEGCEALNNDNDYSNTEPYVTYNWGRRAQGLEQTNLGWVNEDNFANRGCQSQNGADCLSDSGWDYEDILRFFYGMDIDLQVAAGECVAPAPSAHGCGAIIDDVTRIIGDEDGCFIVGCASADALLDVSAPAGQGAVVATSTNDENDCVGRWQFAFSEAGERRIDVHVPGVNGAAEAGEPGQVLSYTLQHAGMQSVVTVTVAEPGWISLGTFFFADGRHQFVELGDATGVTGSPGAGPFVAFDSIAVGLPGGSFPADADASPPAEDEGAADAGEPDGGGGSVEDGGTSSTSDASGEEPSTDDDEEEADSVALALQECSCAIVPRSAPTGPLAAVFFILFFSRAAARRMPSSRWRR